MGNPWEIEELLSSWSPSLSNKHYHRIINSRTKHLKKMTLSIPLPYLEARYVLMNKSKSLVKRAMKDHLTINNNNNLTFLNAVFL